MPRRAPTLAMLVLGAAACSSGAYGGTTGGRPATTGRPSTIGAGAASGTTTGGAATSGGSTSGGSSGTTGEVCGQAFVDAWNDGGDSDVDCTADQVELKGRVGNACAENAPLLTGADDFTTSDYFNPALVAHTGPCGVYWYCVDPGTDVTPLFRATGYVETLGSTLDVTTSAVGYGVAASPGVGLICTSFLAAEAGSTSQLTPAVDVNLALVEVTIFGGPTQACADKAGWTYDLVTDGGMVLDAGVAYLNGGSLPLQSDGGTSSQGVTLLYNLDPSLSPVTLIAHHPGFDLPDGGQLCPNQATLAPWDHTGEIPLSASALTFVLYKLP